MLGTCPSWSCSPPISGYNKSAAEGHLSWRIQLGKKRGADHSDIRELISELLSLAEMKRSFSSAVTRLIWLYRAHTLFKKKKSLSKRRLSLCRGEVWNSELEWNMSDGSGVKCLRTCRDNLCDLLRRIDIWSVNASLLSELWFLYELNYENKNLSIALTRIKCLVRVTLFFYGKMLHLVPNSLLSPPEQFFPLRYRPHQQGPAPPLTPQPQRRLYALH